MGGELSDGRELSRVVEIMGGLPNSDFLYNAPSSAVGDVKKNGRRIVWEGNRPNSDFLYNPPSSVARVVKIMGGELSGRGIVRIPTSCIMPPRLWPGWLK